MQTFSPSMYAKKILGLAEIYKTKCETNLNLIGKSLVISTYLIQEKMAEIVKVWIEFS